MAERLRRAQPDSVANHVKAHQVTDRAICDGDDENVNISEDAYR